MKKLLIIGSIIILFLVACGYAAICPAPELAGTWKYTDTENQANNQIIVFNDFDNYCEIIDISTYEYIYSLNESKTKITLKRANSFGGTFDTIKRTYDIDIKKNYFILNGLDLVKDKIFKKVVK